MSRSFHEPVVIHEHASLVTAHSGNKTDVLFPSSHSIHLKTFSGNLGWSIGEPTAFLGSYLCRYRKFSTSIKSLFSSAWE